MGARGHGGRNAADQKAFDPAHSPCANEDAVGAPTVRLGDQRPLRLFLFHHHVGSQCGGAELAGRFINHLFDSDRLFGYPFVDRTDHMSRSKLRRRPRGVDNASFAARGPFASGDGFYRDFSAFRSVNANDQPDWRTWFFDTSPRYSRRTSRFVQYFLRDAAEKELPERRSPVRPNHDQIGPPLISLLDNHRSRGSRGGFGLHIPARLHRNQTRPAAPRQRQILLISINVLDNLKPGRRRQPVLDNRQDFDLRVSGQTGPWQVVQRGVSAFRSVVSGKDSHSIRHIRSFYFPV